MARGSDAALRVTRSENSLCRTLVTSRGGALRGAVVGNVVEGLEVGVVVLRKAGVTDEVSDDPKISAERESSVVRIGVGRPGLRTRAE